MKVVVDENMPYARELFSRLGEVRTVPGRPLPRAALNGADALMVRSVTKVNAELLAGSGVKFVGSATAGTDHVDRNWLDANGIGFGGAGLQCDSRRRICLFFPADACRTGWIPTA